MFTRVTHQTQAQAAYQNLQANKAALNEVHQRATSQKAIQRPSDDPIATSDSLRVRADHRAAEQYARNVSDGLNWLTTVDSTITSVTDVMHRVRDLTVRGASDSMSPASREAIAIEIESLREHVFNLANTTFAGRPVFAGNSDAGVAYTADLAYTGEPGSTVQRRVSPDTTVRVDADGTTIFGAGGESVFALLDDIAADLRSRDPQTHEKMRTHLDSVDARMKTIVGRHADVGARHAEVMRAKEMTVATMDKLDIRRSEIEDVDLAKAILDLQAQEVGYQAALQVTARVLQPSLMDFLS